MCGKNGCAWESLSWFLQNSCSENGANYAEDVEKERHSEFTETEEIPDWMPVLTVSAFVADEEANTRTLTPLEVGEDYIVHVGGGGANIELEFTCDGYVIEVTGEDAMMELSVGSKDFGPWDSGDSHESRTVGFTQQVTSDGFVSVAPIFCGSGNHLSCADVVGAWGAMASFNEQLRQKFSNPGQELYLSVNVYELKNVNAPILFARICLTQLEDPDAHDKHSSGRFNICIEEYELSDKYKMMIE